MGVGGNPTQIVAGASRNASSRTESVALPMGAPSINHHASPYAPLHESSRPPEFAAPALKDGAAPAQSVQVGGCTHLFCHGGRHYTIHDEPPSSRDAGPCPAATPCRECGGSGDGEMCGFCVRCNGSGVEPVLDAENPPPAAPAALGQAQPGPWCQKHGDRCCCEPDHDGPCMYASGKAIPEKPKTLSEGEAGPRLGICMKHGGDLHAERPECMLWAAAAPIPEKPSPAVPGEEDLRIAWDLCPIYQKHDFGLPCRECHRIAAKLARIRADEREALASMFASGNLSLPWRADEIAAAIRSRGSRR